MINESVRWVLLLVKTVEKMLKLRQCHPSPPFAFIKYYFNQNYFDAGCRSQVRILRLILIPGRRIENSIRPHAVSACLVPAQLTKIVYVGTDSSTQVPSCHFTPYIFFF